MTGKTKPGTASATLSRGYNRHKTPRGGYRAPSPNSPPNPVFTKNQLNQILALRAKALLNYKLRMEADAAERTERKAHAEKARNEAKSKRIANAIRNQTQRNNRLAKAGPAAPKGQG